MNLTTKLIEEAGNIGELFETLFKEFQRTDRTISIVSLYQTAEFLLDRLQKETSRECYDAYKNKYYEMVSLI